MCFCVINVGFVYVQLVYYVVMSVALCVVVGVCACGVCPSPALDSLQDEGTMTCW